MNISLPSPQFPMEKVIDCSEVVAKTMLPQVKGVLLWLVIAAILGNLWQIRSIWNVATAYDLIGSCISILFLGGILSVVLTFP